GESHEHLCAPRADAAARAAPLVGGTGASVQSLRLVWGHGHWPVAGASPIGGLRLLLQRSVRASGFAGADAFPDRWAFAAVRTEHFDPHRGPGRPREGVLLRRAPAGSRG